MRKIGYARVGPFDKSADAEAQRLADAGCCEIHKDTKCGPGAARPMLDEAMSKLRAGDTLVVCSLSRPAKSIKHLMELATELDKRGAHLCSLSEGIDTAQGPRRSFLSTLAALGDMERALARERALEGLNGARARGRNGGKKESLSEQEQALLVQRRTEGASVLEMCNEFGIAKATYYRYVHKLVAVDTMHHYGLQKSEATPLGEGAEQ